MSQKCVTIFLEILAGNRKLCLDFTNYQIIITNIHSLQTTLNKQERKFSQRNFCSFILKKSDLEYYSVLKSKRNHIFDYEIAPIFFIYYFITISG